MQYQPLEQVRVREKQRNLFLGRIIRDQTGEQTLKQLKITSKAQVVIQMLPEPELLDSNIIILVACRRDIQTRTYGEKKEFRLRFPEKSVPTIHQLWESCRASLGLGPTERISVAKYVPHLFEWKWFNPEEEIIEKQGKKKKVEIKTLAAVFDLRKFPFLVTDGDIIGVRVETDPGAEIDDFQTEADILLKEDFRIEQERDKQEKEKNRKQGGGGKRNVENALVFNTGF